MLIGSVKSNMGHAEPASGLCSVAKIIVAIQRGMIPPNLHFNEANDEIQGLKDGRLKVLTESTPMPPGCYIGINNHGFGGSNAHLLLKTHEPAKDGAQVSHPERPEFPKLILYSGRTKEAVENALETAGKHQEDYYLQEILANQVANH